MENALVTVLAQAVIVFAFRRPASYFRVFVMDRSMPQILKTTLLVASATLLFCYLGFYNGFPLLYPDTGTYVRSGFTGEVPIDRPIFYGMFLRHVSLAKSLWLVVLAQSALLAWLLLLTVRRFVKESRVAWYYIATVAMLVLMTGVSYFTNVLLPDIFTPILLLSGFHLALFSHYKWPLRIFLGLVVILAAITHLSHFPTSVLTIMAGLAIGWLRRKHGPAPIARKSILLVSGTLAFAFLLIPTVNKLKTGSFEFSRGGDIFMTNRLRDLNILKDFLDKDCANQPWKLCPYKEDLYGDFLWDQSQSPLYKTGGWEANFDEYQRMNAAIFRNPRFLARYAVAGFQEGIGQFFVFQTGPWTPQLEESAPVNAIKTHMNGLLRACLASKQIRNKLDLTEMNRRQELAVIGSLVLLFLLALDRRRFGNLPTELRWLLLLTVLFTLANAFVCAALSNIDPRYQGRVAWLYVFDAMLVLMVWMEKYDLPGRLKRWLGQVSVPDENPG